MRQTSIINRLGACISIATFVGKCLTILSMFSTFNMKQVTYLQKLWGPVSILMKHSAPSLYQSRVLDVGTDLNPKHWCVDSDKVAGRFVLVFI